MRGGHQGDGTEGGEEGKGEGEEGGEGGEEIFADGQAHGPIKGSTRGPRLIVRENVLISGQIYTTAAGSDGRDKSHL